MDKHSGAEENFVSLEAVYSSLFPNTKSRPGTKTHAILSWDPKLALTFKLTFGYCTRKPFPVIG